MLALLGRPNYLTATLNLQLSHSLRKKNIKRFPLTSSRLNCADLFATVFRLKLSTKQGTIEHKLFQNKTMTSV